jgi:y4mF family transcriptional regulator
MTPDEIGKTVRYFRKQSGLSQEALAKLAGIGKTAVFDIEKGKETIQLNTLLRIFEVLNVKIKLETPFAMPTEGDA